ncbi:MAG: hypothetical protein CW342_13955 [Thermoactinomycetaceae bacterium]|jgi:hypothetical protein|nr:hypothetical protein [Bacillota bacterium]MBO2533953.1 hypothetical protein [Thermoactinomycetaceae bacterium]
MSKPWRICISSPPDREKLVAEIFYGDHQWAEVNQEGSVLQIEIYPRMDGQPWRIPYEQVIHVLEEAKKQLVD